MHIDFVMCNKTRTKYKTFKYKKVIISKLTQNLKECLFIGKLWLNDKVVTQGNRLLPV